MIQQEFTGTDFSKFHTLAFDLDGTLAISKRQMPSQIGKLLGKLSFFYDVAIISGGDWPQFESQVLPALNGLRHCRAA